MTENNANQLHPAFLHTITLYSKMAGGPTLASPNRHASLVRCHALTDDLQQDTAAALGH